MPGFYYPTGRTRNVTITGGGSFVNDKDQTGTQGPPIYATPLPVYAATVADASIWYFRSSVYAWLGFDKLAGSDEFVDRPDIVNVQPYFQTYYQTRCTIRVTLGINFDGAADLGRPAIGAHSLQGLGHVDVVTPWFIHGYWNPDGTFRGHTSCYRGINPAHFDDSNGTFTVMDVVTLKEHLRRDATFDSTLPAGDKDLVPYYATPCEIPGARSFDAEASASFVVMIVDVDDSTNPVYFVQQTVGGAVNASLTFSDLDPSPRDPAVYESGQPEFDLNEYGWGYRLQGLGLNKAITASVSFGGALASTAPGPGCHKGQAALTGTWDSVSFAWGGADPMYKTADPDANHFWNPQETTWGSALVRAWPDWGLDVTAGTRHYADGSPLVVTMQHVNAVDGVSGPTDTIIAEWDTPATYQPTGPHGTTFFQANSTCDDGIAVADGATFGYTQLLYTLSQPGNSILVDGHNFNEGTGGLFRPKPGWADTYGTFGRSDHWLVHGRENFIQPYRHFRQEFLKMSLGQNFDAAHLLFNSTHNFQVFAAAWTAAAGGTAVVVAGVLTLTFAAIEQQAHPTTYVLVPCAYRYHDITFRADTAGARCRLGLSAGSKVYGWILTAGAAGVDTVVTVDLGEPDQLFVPAGGGTPAHWVSVGRVVHPAEERSGIPFAVTLEALDLAEFTFSQWTGRYVTGGTHKPIRLLGPLEGQGDLQMPNSYDVNHPDPPGYSPPTVARFFRLMVNGVNTFDANMALGFNVENIPPDGVGPGTHEGFWQSIYAALDTTANDTGIVVVRGSDTFYRWPALDGYELLDVNAGTVLPFGKIVAPAGEAVFTAKVRRVGWAFYYGMGDIEGDLDVGGVRHPAYGTRIRVRLEWVFDGEVFTNVGTSGGLVGAVDLLDNPTASTIETVSADDDGLYRFTAHYGVLHPIGNVSLLAATFPTPGNNLNSDWLSRGGVHLSALWRNGTQSPDAVFLDRFPLCFTLILPGKGVWNMHDRVGAYHRADVLGSGAIAYHRADLPVPPFVLDVQATAGPEDSDPRMCSSGIDRIHLLFTRGTDVMLTWSDDDGATWSDPMALFTGAKHPANAPTDVGTVIHAAYSGGHITANEEIAPEQFTAAWTFVDAAGAAIAVDDDSFSFSLAKEGAARHVLVLTQGGNVVEYESSDDARTWTLIT